MPRLCANLTLLFTEVPMEARFRMAAEAGFAGVEILFPYDDDAADLAARTRRHGLEMVLINCPPPNWAGGPRGFAAQPEQAARFRRDFNRAVRLAQRLRARHIHIMAGVASGAAAQNAMVANLAWACDHAPHASLLIEPLNTTDNPGYFLCDYDQAAAIIAAVGRPNLGLQFDAYHAHLITGDVFASFDRHRALIRHIQVAGLPGRHEPVAGGPIDYPAFFAMLDRTGWPGWVSAEYNPAHTTEDGLFWMPDAAAPPRRSRGRRWSGWLRRWRENRTAREPADAPHR